MRHKDCSVCFIRHYSVAKDGVTEHTSGMPAVMGRVATVYSGGLDGCMRHFAGNKGSAERSTA